MPDLWTALALDAAENNPRKPVPSMCPRCGSVAFDGVCSQQCLVTIPELPYPDRNAAEGDPT